MQKSRFGWAVLLVLAAIPIGFAIGAWLGARFLVPADAGLAGGAMVLWYGFLGMVLALVASIIASRMLDPARLKPVALVAGGLAACLLVLFGIRINQQQDESDAHLRQTVAMLPPFEIVVAGEMGNGLNRFSYASASNDLRLERGDNQRCQGGLPVDKTGDRSRVELLSALRGLDVAGVLVESPACQQAGEVLATIEIEIREAKPPMTAGRLRVTRACREEIPEIDAVFDAAQAVHQRHRSQLDCR